MDMYMLTWEYDIYLMTNEMFIIDVLFTISVACGSHFAVCPFSLLFIFLSIYLVLCVCVSKCVCLFACWWVV